MVKPHTFHRKPISRADHFIVNLDEIPLLRLRPVGGNKGVREDGHCRIHLLAGRNLLFCCEGSLEDWDAACKTFTNVGLC